MAKTLTAAPVVRQPMSVIGAPGKTDFSRIYIASELNTPEYRTTLRHEQAHVWARHNSRHPKDLKRPDLWITACEMEIARTIYDERDIENINAPRSRLAGGYLPGSIEGLPKATVTAEAIYDWLLRQPEAAPKMKCMCSVHFPEGDESSGQVSQEEASDLAQEAREQLDADEVSKASQAAVGNAYASILSRPPTLTEAVDAALRVRIERERSHRRPSRRHGADSILMPGSISTPRPPLVEIFVDRSGSFSPEKTAKSEFHLRELLSRYGATIRSDVWFFGSGMLTDRDSHKGGDTPYHLISAHLAKTTPKLAIVITDDDPVSKDVTQVVKGIGVVCIPVGCSKTNLAGALGGRDVVAV
jgi:hypothetical protein